MSVLVTGCSTFRPAPPTGLMWAYLSESQTVRSLTVVIYTLDRPTCEGNRAKDVKQPPGAAWAGLKIPAASHAELTDEQARHDGLARSGIVG
jgi:hypothetical protein